MQAGGGGQNVAAARSSPCRHACAEREYAGDRVKGAMQPTARRCAWEPMSQSERPADGPASTAALGILGQKYFQDLPNISKDRWGPVQRGGRGPPPGEEDPPLGVAEGAQAKQLEEST